MRLPILTGPLRGRWWLPAARGKLLRVIGGSYEREQTALFLQCLRPGQTVLDIGAHVGYYTLLAADRVGAGGKVHAFEPDPRNARFLRAHVRINGQGHVTVAEAAVSDRTGRSRFGCGTGSGTGRLDRKGATSVRVVQLDEYCASRGLAPDVLKIDVEGGEMRVLSGSSRVLESQPDIFLSTHGAEIRERCLEYLRHRGYDPRPIRQRGEEEAEFFCTADHP